MWKFKWLHARSILDPLDYASFIESAELLGPKAFTYGKIAPHYNLIICVV
jgi:hypothetical protein